MAQERDRFPRPFSPKTILDIATGTGDLAISMYKKLRPDHIVGADISLGMMEVGRKKVAAAGYSEHISFEQQDWYGLDLRGKLVRCRNRRFRGS